MADIYHIAIIRLFYVYGSEGVGGYVQVVQDALTLILVFALFLIICKDVITRKISDHELWPECVEPRWIIKNSALLHPR